MAEKSRRIAPATLLIVLAVASFTTAAITLTNITEWHVYAKTPPIVKVDGDLYGYGYGNYVNVTTTSGGDGTNRTVISVLGFTGDPVKYDNVLYICNKDYQNYAYNVYLVYNGLLYDTSWDYVEYVKLFFGGYTLEIRSSTNIPTQVGPMTITHGSCEPISVEVLVKPNAPYDGETRLIAIQVDVVSVGPVP